MVDRRRQFDLCREEARRVAVAISRLPELLAMEKALKVGEPGEDDTLATFKRKPPDLPPEVGRRLIADMHAFYAEPDKNMADEIASGILHMCASTTERNFGCPTSRICSRRCATNTRQRKDKVIR